MTQTRFEPAARLDPAGFLTAVDLHLRFCRGLDTQTTPEVEVDAEWTGDTVAELEAVKAPAPPWLFPLEFQTEPNPDMFGRLLRQGGQMWLDHRPDPQPDGAMTGRIVRDRYLAEESAADLLRRVGAGR